MFFSLFNTKSHSLIILQSHNLNSASDNIMTSKNKKLKINKHRFLAEFSRRVNANQRALMAIFDDSLVPLQQEGRVSVADMRNLYEIDYLRFNQACERLYPELVKKAAADGDDKAKIDWMGPVSIGIGAIGAILGDISNQRNQGNQTSDEKAPAETPAAETPATPAEEKKSNSTTILVVIAVVLVFVVAGIIIAKKK